MVLRIGVLGEVCKLFRGGIERGEIERRVLRNGPGEGCRNGGRKHHLCGCNFGFDFEW